MHCTCFIKFVHMYTYKCRIWIQNIFFFKQNIFLLFLHLRTCMYMCYSNLLVYVLNKIKLSNPTTFIMHLLNPLFTKITFNNGAGEASRFTGLSVVVFFTHSLTGLSSLFRNTISEISPGGSSGSNVMVIQVNLAHFKINGLLSRTEKS